MARRVAAPIVVAVGLAAAVAIAVLAWNDRPLDDRTQSAPPPAHESYVPPDFRPAPDARWRTSIPARVRIDLGLPRPGGSLGRTGVSSQLCAGEMFPIEGVVDRLVISSSGPEYAEARDLRVFATDAVAHDFVSGIGVAVAACPTLKVRSTVWSQELRVPGIGGEESLTVVQTFATDGVVAPGANWWEVVRVGNTVLLTGTGGEWGPGSALDLARQEHARAVRPIVVGLCVFSAARCPASGSAR